MPGDRPRRTRHSPAEDMVVVTGDGGRRLINRMAALVALAATVFVLASCGSAHVNPSRSPTLTSLPSRPVQTETETQTRTESRIAVQTRTATETETRTQTATTTRTAAATPNATQTSDAASSGDNSAPAWLWWLAGAVVLAAVVTTALLLRRRSKKHAWEKKFDVTKGEVAWFARQLVPQLGRAPTAQQIAGGWRIEADRVISIEDHLTTLEASAVDDLGRRQARTLRDAVRAARIHLATLDIATDTLAATGLLQSAAAELETALSSVDAATQVSAAGSAL